MSDRELPADRLLEQVAEVQEGLVAGREADAATLMVRRAELAAEPGYGAAVDALAATRAELAVASEVPLPEGAPQRWAALVEELTTATEPVRAARRRRFGLFGGLAAAVSGAAIVVGGAVGGVFTAPARPEVSGVQLAGEALATRGVADAGELADPDRRARCLAAVAPDVPADAPLVGGREVLFDGRPGTLLLLGTGRLGQFTAVVVDERCTAVLTRREVP